MRTLEDVKPGDTLGRYELLVPVAQGGMAAVWAARQKGSRGFQRIVAIKTILPGLVDDPMFEQMFLDEASLASRVRHPNVAQILDLGEENDVLYLVMEWVDGEALSVLLRLAAKRSIESIPIPVASRIVMQAAAALHAAHELRDDDGKSLELVHRDVSPQNILLTYDGIVKVVDFGVAKAAGRSAAETTAGQLKGKVPYMSPEQARGGRIDRRTDIFALGAVYYQLVTGTHPFRGENDLVTLNNIASRPMFRPRLKDPKFPREIEEVLAKALAKDVTKRYATMADFEAAIGAALAKLGLVASDGVVADFMGGLMGDRAKKRRESLKEAMKAADEQTGTAARMAPRLLSPSSSGIGPAPSGRASAPSVPGAEVVLQGAAPTLAAVEAGGADTVAESPSWPPPRSAPRKKLIVAAGSVVALGLAATVAVVSTRGGPSPDVHGLNPSSTSAPAGSAETPSVEDAGAAPVPAASGTVDVPVQATDGGEEEEKKTIPAVDTAATVEPPPTGAAPVRAGGGPSKGGTAVQTQVTAPATNSATPSVKRRKVPEVQNPGF